MVARSVGLKLRNGGIPDVQHIAYRRGRASSQTMSTVADDENARETEATARRTVDSSRY